MSLFNLGRMTTATTGTGTITLGSAVAGFLSFADAGVTDGATVTYAIKDGSNREIGRGTYTASGTTLTRTVLQSTNSDSAINLSGSAEVITTAAAEDVAHETFVIACSDETSDLTTGTAKATFRMPFALTVTDVKASVTTAPTGAAITVDINDGGTTILSTKLTIDATEKTSATAATAAVISDTALANDAEITIDIDSVGSTVAGAGLKVSIIGYRS